MKKISLSWTPKMSVNEAVIDKQHQKLLAQIDKLINEASTGEEIQVVRDTLHFLHTYIKDHLSYEEDYMKRIGYPGFKGHKQIHKAFIKFFRKFLADFEKVYLSKGDLRKKLKNLADKSKKFLKDWWINHISTVDHKYAEFAASKSRVKKGKLKEFNTKKKPAAENSPSFDMSAIKAEIESKLKKGRIKEQEAQILEQRAPLHHVIKTLKDKKAKIKKGEKSYVLTGVAGFDKLFENGIPKGSTLIIAGGAGSGKTILCLQTLNYHASRGEKCFYMSFEESEERLVQHMKDFGWDPEKLIKSGKLRIKRYSPFDITRSVDAMLAKEKGELLIELDPVILPKDFKPDFIALDSLTAIASAFTGKEDSYRIYIEQLFRFFEKLGSTSFLITETKQIPEIFSTTGVEEFLADGVIVFYNLKRGNVRENAIEILKMRGEKHQKKIVAMQITDNGIIVYPEQEVFGGVE